MNEERLLKVIIAPHISEKGTMLADKFRQFIFKIENNATKIEVKKAIEFLFKVEVDSVQICNVKGKKKIFKQVPGRRKNWKKAYVTLKEGYDLEFIGAE